MFHAQLKWLAGEEKNNSMWQTKHTNKRKTNRKKSNQQCRKKRDGKATVVL